MEARIQNPVLTIPGLFDTLQALGIASNAEGLSKETRELVALRASQINGCSVCLDMHTRGAKKSGESDERLFTLAAWRDTPYFSDSERAALALTEAATRLCDRSNPVPDDVWNDAAKYFDEPALSALVVTIAAINLWNRLNIVTGQIAGEWTAQFA
jgi:AhpD family alkylhydroperoxidase